MKSLEQRILDLEIALANVDARDEDTLELIALEADKVYAAAFELYLKESGHE